MSKIIRIFLVVFFMEEYHFRGTFFVIDIENVKSRSKIVKTHVHETKNAQINYRTYTSSHGRRG